MYMVYKKYTMIRYWFSFVGASVRMVVDMADDFVRSLTVNGSAVL